MTTPFERTQALVLVGDFLEALRAAPAGSIPENIRAKADGLLRHYPSTFEIGQAADREEHRAIGSSRFFDPQAMPPRGERGNYRR